MAQPGFGKAKVRVSVKQTDATKGGRDMLPVTESFFTQAVPRTR